MKILVGYRQIHNTAGGVEKMSSLIMNEMTIRGHGVDYITLDQTDAVSFYPLSPDIYWHKLAIGDPSQSADFKTRLARIKAMRVIIRETKPDVILAFQEAAFLSLRLAAIGLSVPVIAAERNAPSRFKFMPSNKRWLAFLSFAFAKYVTIQCENFKKSYPAFLKQKLQTIPNPIFPAKISPEPKKNIVLSVGRLEFQKNFQCIVTAFAMIAEEFPDWLLKIAGEGDDRAELEQMIADNNLGARIILSGTINDLKPFYDEASIFCLASRWEGFPNALGEAQANGIPSVGFIECDGVNELIQNGVSGLLVAGNGNPESLAQGLRQLMTDTNLRKRMSLEAYHSVQYYRPAAIFDRWEKLLHKAVGETSGS